MYVKERKTPNFIMNQ